MMFFFNLFLIFLLEVHTLSKLIFLVVYESGLKIKVYRDKKVIIDLLVRALISFAVSPGINNLVFT